jgi:type VI protein secretion system component VasK
MIQIIIGCILANILTIVIIGIVLYWVYRKNEDRIKTLDAKIDQKVEDVKNKVGAVMNVVDQIRKLLDKINKK